MNLKGLQRSLEISGLRWRAAIKQLIFELEPAGSTEKRSLRADWKSAKHQLDQALLREREARMNRRVF